MLLAGVWRRRSFSEVEVWLAKQAPGRRMGITIAVLGGLLALSIAAASFGWLGMLSFWFIVILLVR